MTDSQGQSRFRVGFCVSGTGRLFRAATILSEQMDVSPALAVLDTDADPALDEFCDAHDVTCSRLVATASRRQLDEQLTETLLAASVDLLCLTFDRILLPEVVNSYPGRIVNVHMALLPSFRGLNALERAVRANVRYAGATIHEVVEDVDRGPIVAQCLVGSVPGDDASSIGRRLYGFLRQMYLQVIVWYREGRVFKDDEGRVWVSDALYGQFPISPAVERAFVE
jgi:folate-dependent phosphoribosylglycinamide formyltransferase PurN